MQASALLEFQQPQQIWWSQFSMQLNKRLLIYKIKFRANVWLGLHRTSHNFFLCSKRYYPSHFASNSCSTISSLTWKSLLDQLPNKPMLMPLLPKLLQDIFFNFRHQTKWLKLGTINIKSQDVTVLKLYILLTKVVILSSESPFQVQNLIHSYI